MRVHLSKLQFRIPYLNLSGPHSSAWTAENQSLSSPEMSWRASCARPISRHDNVVKDRRLSLRRTTFSEEIKVNDSEEPRLFSYANCATAQSTQENTPARESRHARTRRSSNWAWATPDNQYDWMDLHTLSGEPGHV
jgi:hypothetical protein